MGKKIMLGSTSSVELYKLSSDLIYANWFGYVSVEDVKDGCILLLKMVKKHKFKHLLNDNTLILGSFTQSINWLKDSFMPEFVNAGITKIAFIYSQSEAAKYSVNRLLEINEDYQGQAFDSYQEAFLWITETNKINIENVYLNIEGTTANESKIIINNIYYISSMQNYVQIITKDDKTELKYTLKDILQFLPQPQFSRIHKSYIANIHFAKKIKYHAGGTYKLYLNGIENSPLPVGRVYAPALRKTLKNIL